MSDVVELAGRHFGEEDSNQGAIFSSARRILIKVPEAKTGFWSICQKNCDPEVPKQKHVFPQFMVLLWC